MLHNVLSRSFHLEVTDRYAKVSNPCVYAAIRRFDWGLWTLNDTFYLHGMRNAQRDLFWEQNVRFYWAF